MSKSNDSIIYLTLIDFLFQLIFFGIFLFVTYASVQDSLHEKIKKYKISDQALVEVIDGLGPFIKASNVDLLVKFLKQLKSADDLSLILENLKLIQSQKEFNEFIKKISKNGLLNSQSDKTALYDFLNEIDDPEQLKKLNTAIKYSGGISKLNEKILAGMGKVSCFSSGSRESIMEIEAYDKFIKVVYISDQGKGILLDKNMNLKIGDEIDKDSIAIKLQPLYDKNCAYFVKYIRKTDSESIRLAVEKNVYTK